MHNSHLLQRSLTSLGFVLSEFCEQKPQRHSSGVWNPDKMPISCLMYNNLFIWHEVFTETKIAFNELQIIFLSYQLFCKAIKIRVFMLLSPVTVDDSRCPDAFDPELICGQLQLTGVFCWNIHRVIVRMPTLLLQPRVKDTDYVESDRGFYRSWNPGRAQLPLPLCRSHAYNKHVTPSGSKQIMICRHSTGAIMQYQRSLWLRSSFTVWYERCQSLTGSRTLVSSESTGFC